jgi:hypothetical protein
VACGHDEGGQDVAPAFVGEIVELDPSDVVMGQTLYVPAYSHIYSTSRQRWWVATESVTAPIVESVMISTVHAQGLSFLSRGEVIASCTTRRRRRRIASRLRPPIELRRGR